jgi:hypothetical protein
MKFTAVPFPFVPNSITICLPFTWWEKCYFGTSVPCKGFSDLTVVMRPLYTVSRGQRTVRRAQREDQDKMSLSAINRTLVFCPIATNSHGMHVCVCVCVRVSVYACTRVHKRLRTHARTYVRMYVCVCMYVSMCVFMYVCIYACTVCVYACMRTCICMYIYLCAYMNKCM